MIRKIDENNGTFNLPEDVMDFKSANGENTTVLNISPESYITACFFAKESVRDIRLTENLNYASLI